MIDDVKPATKPSSGSDKQTKTDSIKLDNAVATIKDELSPLDSNSEHSNFNIDDLALDPKVKKEPKEQEKPEHDKIESNNKKPQKQGGRKWHFKWPPSKKEWLSSLIIILICGTIIGFVINHIGHKPVVNAVKIALKKPAPVISKLVPNTLTGLPVNPIVNKIPVTGVMIENSDFARPQSGLGQAGVVFEAIAEGGITRFLALFQDSAPANIGPIRSVRPYYEQWAEGFDASIAHVGGSPEALADIKAWSVKDLDEFYNGGYYHRITTRAAPHNMYTSIAQLNQFETAKGYVTTNFTGFLRKKAQPVKVPPIKTINLAISGPDFAVHYDYSAITNSYNRSEAGAPHIDTNTNVQISPQVVIAMVIPYSLEADHYHSDYGVVGSGPVFVFQDGILNTGTWSKPTPRSQISFVDAKNLPLKLNPGQTWITAVIRNSDVTYAP